MNLAGLACTWLLLLNGQAKTTAADAKLITLEKLFAKSAKDAGLDSLTPPPKLVFKHIASFGDFESSKNTLLISTWDLLTPQERGMFSQLAGPNATEKDAVALFESGVHKWVFIHELGHWTQVTRMKGQKVDHYETELDANRVAMAFWRDRDPQLIRDEIKTLSGIYNGMPNPVPSGSDPQAYFDENYDKLGLTPAYIWFQAEMVLKVFSEKPAPSFREALSEYQPSLVSHK